MIGKKTITSRSRSLRSAKSIALFLFISIFTIHNSFSYTATDIGINDLVDKSHGVFKAEVVGISTGFDGDIYTWVDFKITELIQGIYDQDILTLKFCGGEYKGFELICTDSPVFDMGDNVVLFVEQDENGLLSTTNGLQGVYFLDSDQEALKNGFHQEVVIGKKQTITPVITSNTELKEMVATDYDSETGTVSRHISKPIAEKNSITNSNRFTYSKVREQVISRTLPNKKLTTIIKPQSDLVKRYPNIRHLKTESDYIQEFIKVDTPLFEKRVRKYFEWKGLSRSTLDQIIPIGSDSSNHYEIDDKNKIVSRLFSELSNISTRENFEKHISAKIKDNDSQATHDVIVIDNKEKSNEK